jgi:hypothetical protein
MISNTSFHVNNRVYKCKCQYHKQHNDESHLLTVKGHIQEIMGSVNGTARDTTTGMIRKVYESPQEKPLLATSFFPLRLLFSHRKSLPCQFVLS